MCGVGKSGRFSEGELKVSGDNTGNGNVFVEILPSKGKSVKTDRHFLELFVAGGCKDLEPIRRKTYDATVGQPDIDCSLVPPQSEMDFQAV